MNIIYDLLPILQDASTKRGRECLFALDFSSSTVQLQIWTTVAILSFTSSAMVSKHNDCPPKYAPISCLTTVNNILSDHHMLGVTIVCQKRTITLSPVWLSLSCKTPFFDVCIDLSSMHLPSLSTD